jgi:outer membrane receptor protein involved in Fe transport
VGAEPYINGQLAEFQYLGTYGFSSYITNGSILPGLYETLLPNPNFTWEVQTSVNLGLEASTLNNRLLVELDYFKNKRDKALFRQNGSIPGSAIDPNLLPPVNYAKLENHGWEFKVNFADQFNKLRYNVGVNGGYAKNKIIKWDEITENVPEYQWAVGKPFGSNGASYLVYSMMVYSPLRKISMKTPLITVMLVVQPFAR